VHGVNAAPVNLTLAGQLTTVVDGAFVMVNVVLPYEPAKLPFPGKVYEAKTGLSATFTFGP